jgi:hypothetical protein
MIVSGPSRLPPGKKPDTLCIGNWVSPRAGLDGCGKSRPHRNSIPSPSSPSASLYRLSYLCSLSSLIFWNYFESIDFNCVLLLLLLLFVAFIVSSSIVVLTQNGQFLVVPLLHSFSDIKGCDLNTVITVCGVASFDYRTVIKIPLHSSSVICHTTGPQPLPKRLFLERDSAGKVIMW